MSDHKIEYGSTGKPHPFHVPEPSIWPFVGALSAGLFAMGMVLFMHDIEISGFAFGLKGVLLGLCAILTVMLFWWRDVIAESLVKGQHSPITQIGFRYGMALFISSEVMFFVAFFWAFFDASLFVNEAHQFLRMEYTQGAWPPPQIEVIDAFDLPFLMTMILLLSGCTVTWAHYEIAKGNQKAATKALGVTVALGFIFMCFQAFEYAHAHFGFSEGSYPSTFYMATGFHGFHVMVGTIFLAVCWIRSAKGHFTKERHFGFEAAAWYWHFVDVVWLFLFISIYWWGNSIGIQPAG